MRPSALFAALYPPAIRQRWGTEIRQAVAAAGIRCWPDTLAGAVRLWLHPSDWPEMTAGQTRRTLLVALAAVTAGTALMLRSIQPSATITADPDRPVTSLWLAPLLLGVAVAVPIRPLLHWVALRQLAGDVVRILTAPAAALVTLFLLAHSGLVAERPTGPARPLLLACYWGTLAFTALRGCALAGRLSRAIAAPSVPRLRAAAMLIGTAMALAAGQGLLNAAHSTPDGASIAAFLTMTVLAAATIHAGLDLRAAT
jgi:hypothetical protein